MTTPEHKTALTLAALGVAQPDQLASLFAEVRARFDAETAGVHAELGWKQFRCV